MTNMLMNGAVAIYGGVGVMEIHQPLPQAVESVAQAVEDLAVNAHISLRELKNCVDKVLEKKIPGYKQLMETNPVVAARATVNGATITAYTNGYAVYEADDAHTVLDVNRCGDYRYDFNDGTYEVVPAEVFEDAEWTVRLVMEGERRLENNRSKISRDYEECALSCDGTDWCEPQSSRQSWKALKPLRGCRRQMQLPECLLERESHVFEAHAKSKMRLCCQSQRTHRITVLRAM